MAKANNAKAATEPHDGENKLAHKTMSPNGGRKLDSPLGCETSDHFGKVIQEISKKGEPQISSEEFSD